MARLVRHVLGGALLLVALLPVSAFAQSRDLPRPAGLRLTAASGIGLDVYAAPGARAIDLALVVPQRDGSRVRGPVFRIPETVARAWVDSLAAFFTSREGPAALRFARVDRHTPGETLVVERQDVAGAPDSLVGFAIGIEKKRGAPDEPMVLWRFETRSLVYALRTHLRAFAPAPVAEDVATSEARTAFFIESPVVGAEKSCAPRYPAELRARYVAGSATARFIVGVDGRVELGSVKILDSTHPAFADAVMQAMPCMRFLPAEMHGRRIRQVVQQPFTFAVQR